MGKELLVLVHGLQGHAADFDALVEALVDRHEGVRNSDGSVGSLVILQSICNTGRTHDGVENGGRRLAEEVTAKVAQLGDDVTHISMVGFSLGGLYSRFALGLLYNPVDGKVAGLRPCSFISVASPHLGVRSFGWFRLVPKWLLGCVAGLLQRQSVLEVMLLDGGVDSLHSRPVLERISVDEVESSSATGERLLFVSALRSFHRTVLYANAQNDFMVPYGSSALQPALDHLFMHPELKPPQGAKLLEDGHDKDGARLWYDHHEAQSETKKADSPAYSSVVSSPNESSTLAASSVAEYSSGGVAFGGESDRALDVNAPSERIEQVIATRLRSAVRWRTVCVDFRMSAPFAHNRILAVKRNWFHKWLNRPGERIVAHLADLVLEHDHAFL
mmetsp:Transcript_6202/g.13231  ORF Transcript_6202/g.13231 Transcript_6202/m.13231 type:complete len:388 (-) Transcript_6202:799-1962(-)